MLSSVLTLCDPMDCGPPGSSVPGISQARVLEWGATSSPRGSASPALAGGLFPTEPPGKPPHTICLEKTYRVES